MKRYISLFCVLAMLLSAFGMMTVGAEDAPATASKWDGVVPEADLDYHFAGEGTEANPYLIQSAAELAQLAANARLNDEATCYFGKYFRLIVDIDLDNHPWYGIGGCFDTAGFAPTTSSTDVRYNAYFGGNFDGDNHKIYNLTLAAKNMNGLFGMVAPSSTGATSGTGPVIKNIGIESGSTTVSGVSRLGCLAGGMRFNVTVENCYNKADLSVDTPGSYGYMGGLIGHILDAGNKHISYCYNTGNVTVTNATKDFRIGGIVGGTTGKTIYIDHCYAFGSVTVTHNKASSSATSAAAGVIAGALMDGPYVTNSYAHADVSSKYAPTDKITVWHIGPFYGGNNGTVAAENFTGSSYTQSANTYFGTADGVEKRWGVGNSAAAAANAFITEVPLAEAKTLADFLPSDLNGFLKASGNDPIATAPAFIGAQATAVENDTYAIRFLLGLDSLDYDAVEFEIVATYEQGGQTVTAKNGFVQITNAYRDILADGQSVTSISEGHNYMSAMVVKNVPANVDISLEVKSYVYVNGVKTLVDTDTVLSSELLAA